MDVLVEVDDFTATVPIPEDAVDEIDATTVNQGFQALGNRTQRLNRTVDRLYMQGTKYGVAGSVVDSWTNSVVAHTVQHDPGSGYVDIDEQIPECRAQDVVQVRVSGVAGATGCNTQVRIRIAYNDGLGSPVSVIGHAIVLQDGFYTPFTLEATHEVSQGTVLAPVEVHVTIEVVNDTAGVGKGVYIFGQLAVSSQRWRA